MFGLRFGDPLSIGGDHLLLLAMVREIASGEFRFNCNLGAPSCNDGLLFPMFESLAKAIIWVVSNLTLNVFSITYILYLLGLSMMFSFSFWALKRLDIQSLPSAIASIAFVTSPFFFFRSLNHDLLSLYYTVPLGASIPLVIAYEADQAGLTKALRSPFMIAAVLVAGTGGIYYGLFTCIFVIMGTAIVSARRRDWKPIAAGAVIAVLICGLLVVTTYGPWTLGLLNGTAPPSPYRGGAWAQMFHGLLLSNAMTDYSDIGLWTAESADYLAHVTAPGLGDALGESYTPEWPGPLITTVILASVVLAPILSFAAAPRETGRRYVLISISSALIAFGVVFALRGGLGYVFNYTIISGLRGQERILPFLSFYALFILCASWQWLAERWGCSIAAASGIVLSLCLIPGMYKAYHVLSNRQSGTLANPAIRENLSSIQSMLAVKDKFKIATVLQLPVIVWPESPFILQFDPYADLLPWLLDRPDSRTRWSYGLSPIQPQYAALAAIAPDLSGFVNRATSLGFDAALIEKTAYSKNDIEAIARHIRPECVAFDDSLRTLFVLTRNAMSCETTAPGSSASFTSPVSIEFRGSGAEFLDTGWSKPEPPGTWSTGRTSAMHLPMPAGAARVSLVFTVYRPDPTSTKVISFLSGGALLARVSVESDKPIAQTVEFTVPAGHASGDLHLTIVVDDPDSPSNHGSTDSRVLGIMLHTASVTPLYAEGPSNSATAPR